MTWEGLTGPYSTITADPPWDHREGFPINAWRRTGSIARRTKLPYSAMSLDEIAALPVAELAADNAHLYLWTTNRYIRNAYGVAESWGFRPSQLVTWCKPVVGVGPGGAFASTSEFVVFARRGTPSARRAPSTWFQWPRGVHSAKPAAFYDLVEQVSPGPYVELFAREPRLGWDHWGFGYESGAA